MTTTYTRTTAKPECEPASWHDWIDAEVNAMGDVRTDTCAICGTIRHTTARRAVWYEVPSDD